MLGHLMEWFYSGLAGIKQPDNANGLAFRAIDIRPEPVGDVTSAQAKTQSPYGTISSKWEKKNGTFVLDVEIPANSKATVYLPVAQSAKLSMNGKIVQATGYEKGKAIVKVGSGVYRFEAK